MSFHVSLGECIKITGPFYGLLAMAVLQVDKLVLAFDIRINRKD